MFAMNKQKRQSRGSLMIGTLLMMLVISAASIAIIGRSRHGAQLAIDSKKGYSAYQASDQAAEAFLNNLKALDNNETGNMVPENTPAGPYCPSGVTCLGADEAVLDTSTEKVAAIYKIQSTVSDQGVGRKLQLDLSERIENGLASASLKAEPCSDSVDCTSGGVRSYNQCDVKVSLTLPSDMTKIKDFEVRRSTSDSLNADPSGYGWRIAGDGSNLHPLTESKTSFILKNGDSYLKSISASQYDKTYHLIVKARNKNPLSLDSLYLANNSGNAVLNFDTPSSSLCADCNNPAIVPNYLSGLGGCYTGPVTAGMEPVKVRNACCNGGEYYQCKDDYIMNSAKDSCSNTRTYVCAAKPATGTDWNTVSSFEQTYNGTSWSPADDSVTEYSATASTTSCCYTCATGYHWDSATNTCVSNTKTFTCGAKPATGTTWNTVSSYTQTWNGSTWIPANSATTYNATASTTNCRYTCTSGYTWNGSSCVEDCSKTCPADPSCECGMTGSCSVSNNTCTINDTRSCNVCAPSSPLPPTTLTASCPKDSWGRIRLNWTAMPGATSYLVRIDFLQNNNPGCNGMIDGWYCPGTYDLMSEKYGTVSSNSYVHQALRSRDYRAWVHTCIAPNNCSTGATEKTFRCY